MGLTAQTPKGREFLHPSVALKRRFGDGRAMGEAQKHVSFRGAYTQGARHPDPLRQTICQQEFVLAGWLCSELPQGSCS